MRTAAYFALLAISVAAGCASAGQETAPGDRDRITTEQLARVPADNAYEAVQQLQPHWLDSRGPTSVTNSDPATAVVFMDGIRAGSLEFLKSVPLTRLSEIRFLSSGVASARFGMGLPRGAIELISKGR